MMSCVIPLNLTVTPCMTEMAEGFLSAQETFFFYHLLMNKTISLEKILCMK